MENELAAEMSAHPGTTTHFRVALAAGAAAGTSVDVALFPLDTIKTRLQSQQGFRAAGGFRGIYSGLLSVTLGSAPTAALFFGSYETTKFILQRLLPEHLAPVSHMVAAATGEVIACLIRVPVEVVKQRAQAAPALSSIKIFKQTLAAEGLYGLYRGYSTTVAREIPFSFIQFPLWEFFKKQWSVKTQKSIAAWQSSLCGALAGGISAALTTPLDVAKTRIMLAQKGSPTASGSFIFVMRHIYWENGVPGLFAGVVPRVMWISIGGAIFLGVYEKVKIVLEGMMLNTVKK
ncbi:hypothetical protein C0Q70_14716 [Pomacea canaliculata]|uniref:S-adenosylmethionine mitochondrial carrier protein n=1 Tax=Pomacea canaliculata TaxID=400727 RepID=A0A2T7NSW6_POMCA|nr:S-adenosylmethionine mitochondrial carrier protein-like [Pomacea canaliculata]XP_025106395.1 S-adenosylmethionine mitochondrial carrier protein-like [Pomacea canaliculata]PVD24246.1 hypothetical protein C0Q70_14716 [Pomacea canaliculata]